LNTLPALSIGRINCFHSFSTDTFQVGMVFREGKKHRNNSKRGGKHSTTSQSKNVEIFTLKLKLKLILKVTPNSKLPLKYKHSK